MESYTIEMNPEFIFEVGVEGLSFAEISQLLAVYALIFENLANGNAHPSGELALFDFTITGLPEKFAPLIETGKLIYKSKQSRSRSVKPIVTACGFQEDEEGETYCHIKINTFHPNFWKGEE